jgi:hypothetical protein
MIVKVTTSPLKMKKYRATMDNGKHFDFGLKGSSTFLDHGDLVKRQNYRKRHLGNETEKKLITNLVPSPSLLSYYLLWGETTDLQKNIKYLNSLWKK